MTYLPHTVVYSSMPNPTEEVCSLKRSNRKNAKPSSGFVKFCISVSGSGHLEVQCEYQESRPHCLLGGPHCPLDPDDYSLHGPSPRLPLFAALRFLCRQPMFRASLDASFCLILIISCGIFSGTAFGSWITTYFLASQAGHPLNLGGSLRNPNVYMFCVWNVRFKCLRSWILGPQL